MGSYVYHLLGNHEQSMSTFTKKMKKEKGFSIPLHFTSSTHWATTEKKKKKAIWVCQIHILGLPKKKK